SDSGAASYDPKPGSSVGFRYGSGSAPSVQPAAPAPAPRPTTAKPKPTTAAPKPTTAAPRPTAAAPRTTQSGAAGAGPSTTIPGAKASGGSGNTPSGPVSPSAPGSASGSPSTNVTPTDFPSSDTEEVVSASQDRPSTGSGGSGRLVGGGVLLLAVATAVGAVALRRRAVVA